MRTHRTGETNHRTHRSDPVMKNTNSEDHRAIRTAGKRALRVLAVDGEADVETPSRNVEVSDSWHWD